MKTRNGFVSNSSSSSFVIAIRKDVNKCEHCGRSDPNLIDLIDTSDSYKTEVRARGFDDVMSEMEYRTEWNFQKEVVEKYISELDKYSDPDKWFVAEITISYHDEMFNNLLTELEERDSVVVVYKEE